MRIGDLGSSLAFALPLEVQSLTFTRSQGHGRGEGLDSVLSWSLFSYFKHVTFEIFTQLHRLDRVTIAIYLSRWQPHAWLSGWCSFHCTVVSAPKRKGMSDKGQSGTREDSDMKPRMQLGLSDTTSSSRPGTRSGIRWHYPGLDEGTQTTCGGWGTSECLAAPETY